MNINEFEQFMNTMIKNLPIGCIDHADVENYTKTLEKEGLNNPSFFAFVDNVANKDRIKSTLQALNPKQLELYAKMPFDEDTANLMRIDLSKELKVEFNKYENNINQEKTKKMKM